MPEQKEITAATEYLRWHVGPWEKALASDSNLLRVALYRGITRGKLRVSDVAEVVEKIRQIKKVNPQFSFSTIISTSEQISKKSAVAAFEKLKKSIATAHTDAVVIPNAKIIFSATGFKHHEFLQTISPSAFLLLNNAYQTKQIPKAHLIEFDEVLGKVKGAGAVLTEPLKRKLARHLIRFEQETKTIGATKAFATVVQNMQRSLSEHALSDLWFETKPQPTQEPWEPNLAIRAKRKIAGAAANTFWTGVELAKGVPPAAKRARTHISSQWKNAVEISPTLEFARKVKPFLSGRLVAGVGLAKRVSSSVKVGKARVGSKLSNLIQNTISRAVERSANTVIHPDDQFVSETPVQISFYENGKAQVTDLHPPGMNSRGTIIMPASKATVPIGVFRRRTGEIVWRNFTSAKHALKLESNSALLSEGHAFRSGPNIFLIEKVRPKKITLRGMYGPVKGKTFKLKAESIADNFLIGRSPEHDIRLLTSESAQQMRVDRRTNAGERRKTFRRK